MCGGSSQISCESGGFLADTNYFRVPIDNGTVEGLNNKAKLVIHKAYGFRTAKNYIRNLYHCLGNLPLPQTVHTFV